MKLSGNDEKTWVFFNFIRRNKRLYRIAKSLISIKRNGIQTIFQFFSAKGKSHLSLLKKELKISKDYRISQEKTEFPREILISIIVPLCNTPGQFLREMIDSVMAQTYKNWELCLVDKSNAGYQDAAVFCQNYAQKDSRIRYCKTPDSCSRQDVLNKAMDMASGDYIGILDHVDVLHPSALYMIAAAVSREGADFLYTDEAVFNDKRVTLKHHKPDYAIDTLYSHNYIGSFVVFSGTLAERSGMFRNEYDGSHYYDFILRYASTADKVFHIPALLYFKRKYEESIIFDSNSTVEEASVGTNVISDHLKTRGINAKVENKFGLPGFYRVNYTLKAKPLVSIIIPNKDNIDMLKNCLSSITEKTKYHNYEIIIVENNSTKAGTFDYYREIERYPDISVVYWQGKGFNYSEICNYGAEFAKGEQLLFLNNDVVIITPNWIEEMLMYSQRDDVGITGIKLYFLNDAVQHAGMVLGLGGIAGHVFLGASNNDLGFMAKLQIVQNMSAVTGACIMVKRSTFDEVGRFSPEFSELFNDVDLCLKIRSKGYLIVWTPYAEAYHLESISRGYNVKFGKKRKIIKGELVLFKEKWGKTLAAGDPYYNSNYSLNAEEYNLK